MLLYSCSLVAVMFIGIKTSEPVVTYIYTIAYMRGEQMFFIDCKYRLEHVFLDWQTQFQICKIKKQIQVERIVEFKCVFFFVHIHFNLFGKVEISAGKHMTSRLYHFFSLSIFFLYLALDAQIWFLFSTYNRVRLINFTGIIRCA